MPQPPIPDCYFCNGTGTVLEKHVNDLVQPGRCICTVSGDEVAAALPGLIADILKRAEQEP
jgi:hypothetical protein